MASNKRAWAICDQCSFRYAHRTMKMNSYGMLVCYNCNDGRFDLKNHPQNLSPKNSHVEGFVKNPRSPNNSDRDNG